MPVFQNIIAAHPGETMIIVAHGVVIRVILTNLLAGYQPGDFDRIAIDFASINDLWFDGAKWTGRELNRVIAASTARPVA
jgi:probable phosphoglycerate mutase